MGIYGGSDEQVRLAGFGRRLYAFFIDQSIIQILSLGMIYFFYPNILDQSFNAYMRLLDQANLLSVAAYNEQEMPALTSLNEVNEVLFNFFLVFGLISLAVGAFYGALFESGRQRATLGKRYCRLLVVGDKGERVSFVVAFARNLSVNLINIALTISVMMFFGLLPIYLSTLVLKNRQTVYDYFLGVRVVVRPKV